MPFMTNGHRDYKKEYAWIKKTGGVRKIGLRVKARRDYIKAYGAHAAAGKDIDHKKPLAKGGDGNMSNLRAVTPFHNRSFLRDKHGHLVSQISKKERQ